VELTEFDKILRFKEPFPIGQECISVVSYCWLALYCNIARVFNKALNLSEGTVSEPKVRNQHLTNKARYLETKQELLDCSMVLRLRVSWLIFRRNHQASIVVFR